VTDRRSVQSIAALAGVVLLLAGILGFVPGITIGYGRMSFAGHGSRAELLGVFQTSILQNVVYLLLGAAGLVLAKTAEGARRFLLGGAVALFLLWLLGLVGAADWLPANAADTWLHFAFGAALVTGAVVARRS
jgi:hypothetical protein